MTRGQPVLSLALSRQAYDKIATGVPILCADLVGWSKHLKKKKKKKKNTHRITVGVVP